MEEKNSIVKKHNIRNIIVITLILFTIIVSAIGFKAEYLNIKEIGSQYTDIFFKRVNNKLYLAGVIFIVTYLLVYISNKITRHGLKKFFEADQKQMPKLPNKTFATIISILATVIGVIVLSHKYTMFANVAWFGKTDPVFGTDIAYYVFSLPFIQAVTFFAVFELFVLIVYTAFYYVIVINVYLDGVDIELLKKNTFLKQIMFMCGLIAFLLSTYIFITAQNILTQDMLTIQSEENIHLVGARKNRCYS